MPHNSISELRLASKMFIYFEGDEENTPHDDARAKVRDARHGFPRPEKMKRG